jgi:hypothetical protein
LLLRGLGFSLAKTDQFVQAAEAAKALPALLEGRFSGAKRASLVSLYELVRQAEEEDLTGQAVSELAGIYPLAHIPAAGDLTQTLTGILTAA